MRDATHESSPGTPIKKHVSASYVEGQNLTNRMQLRRFARLTNVVLKRFENHIHMVALYTVWYNFCRIHKSLRVTSAMVAGVTDHLWSMEDIAALIEAIAPKPGPRGPCKQRAAS